MTAPYVGLRPFEYSEANLFYGRGEHIAAMVRTLRQRHFLAVVGSSGSGKSSLVRAGLLPAIDAGFMNDDAGEHDWRRVIVRPGRDPYENLLQELLPVLAQGESLAPELIEFRRQTLRGGPRGMVDVVADSLLPASTRLVVLIDQFEEIFRFLDRGRASQASEREKSTSEQRNAALAFVDLLLATAAERDPRLFVVLTMRSEYLGECEAFLGLSEAIAKSQFLTPRMKREQIQDTIERPLAAVGARIEPVVVTTLLNALGTAQDQLPRVEHILLRMWDRAKTRSPIELTMDDYRQVGEFDGALNQHADELFGELGAISTTGAGPERERVAECMFRLLADRTAQGALVRRLSSVGEVASVAGASESTVSDVVRHFLQSGCHFLVATPSPTTEKTLGAETSLDISHESLLRQWHKLSRWVRDEAELAAEIRRLKDDAWYWQAGMRGLLREPELSYLTSRRKLMPSTDWAARYIHPDELNLLDAYLAQSTQEKERQLEEEARERQRELEIERQRASEAEAAAERQRTLTQYAVFAALVAAVLVVVAAWKTMSANNERKRARVAQQKAVKNERKAGDNAAMANLVTGRGSIENRTRDPDVAVLFWAKAFSETKDSRRKSSLRNLIGAWSRRDRRFDNETRPLAYSPDGLSVITGSIGGRVRLWNSRTGELRWKGEHRDNVFTAAFRLDGQVVVTGSGDETARLWDARTGRPIGEPLHHNSQVLTVAFSPDGRSVLTRGLGPTVRLWDARGGKLRCETQPHKNSVLAVAFSPDGQTLLTGSSDQTARLWDARTGTPRSEPLPHDFAVVFVAFSSDGKTILTGTGISGVSDLLGARLWDVDTGHARGEALKHNQTETGVVSHATFSPDGQSVLTTGYDNTAILWEVKSAKPRCEPLRHESRVLTARFSPDGSTVITGSADRTAKLWDARTGVPRGAPLTHDDSVFDVSFGPDGKTAVTASADSTARFWDVRTGASLGAPLTHDGPVLSVEYSPDGETVLTSANRWSVWDAPTGEPLVKSNGNLSEVNSLAFSSDGELMIVGGDDGKAWLRDSRAGTLRSGPLEHGGPIYSVAFSPNGESVITAGRDKTAWLWDLRTDSRRRLPLTHEGAVYAVAFSPDGRYVATGSEDASIKLWDAESGSLKKGPWRVGMEVFSMAFSPDSQSLLIGRPSYRPGLIDIDTGSYVNNQFLESHVAKNGVVTCTAFSPDGQTILTGSSDLTARLTNARTGEPHGEPFKHFAPVRQVAFSPDGQIILTLSGGTVYLWDTETRVLRGAELRCPDQIGDASFSPDGKTVLAGCTNGDVKAWRIPPPAIDDRRHPERLRMSVEVRTGKRLDENGVVKRLTFDEWNERRRKLDEMGGPCDRPTWDEYNAWQRTQPLGAAGPRL